MTSRLFGVGVSGTGLTAAELEILERDPPWALILFRRNIATLEQTRALAAAARDLGALVLIDQEGGSVDRLAGLFGPSLSFRAAAERGVARRAGELAGEACALAGAAVDLAPVVDRRLGGASAEVLRDRSVSADPDAIRGAALEFLEGLASRGVGGCVKHFPGLGRAKLDTHKHLPVLQDDAAAEALDLAPFEGTMEAAGAVMIAHAAGADGVPSSLSRKSATELLRARPGFSGAAFSDDLEMGALSAFGDLPERCVAAARAGCDLLLVCSRIEEYPACVAAVRREVPLERRLEAAARLERYAERVATLRGDGAPPLSPEDLREAIARLVATADGSRPR